MSYIYKPGDKVNFKHLTKGSGSSNVYCSSGVIQKIEERFALVKEETGDAGVYMVPLINLEPIEGLNEEVVMKNMNRTFRITDKIADKIDKIVELYRAFRDKFRGHKDFWESISKEEMLNASLLREFAKTIDDADTRFNLDHINEEALDRSIKFLEDEIEKACNNKTAEGQAFQLARNIEKGLLESEYMTIFLTKTGERPTVFTSLKSDAQKHKDMLNEKCDMYGGEK